jgi:chemotaxis response regulator CheB
MIVEDNELNMKLFRDLIEASGYETIQTRNGMEALDLARKHRPDLILMDIQLPEVSGLEVTKWLKDRTTICTSHPGDRGDRLRDEGRRGAHPPGWMRGLHLQADLGAEIHRDHQDLSRAMPEQADKDEHGPRHDSTNSRRRRHSGQCEASRSPAARRVFRGVTADRGQASALAISARRRRSTSSCSTS